MGRSRLDGLPRRSLPGGLELFEARSHRARLLGLALLATVEPTAALAIPRCRSVHTFGMRFALDLVFLDARGGVVSVVTGVGPRRLVTCRAASSVVEARGGAGGRFAVALRLEAQRAAGA